MVICRGKPSRGVCVNKCGTLGAVAHCAEFDPVLVQRAKMEEKDFMDKMGVYDVVPRSAAAEKMVPCYSHQMGHSQQGIR